MDIKITDKALRYFLESPVKPEELAKEVSLCGPTFDRIHQIDDDYLYEIEVITNRIDTASAQGIARDAVAILKQQGIKAELKNDPYKEKNNLYPHLPQTFLFEIADPNLVPRFTAVSLENITVKDSSQDTKDLLTRCDQRTINNIVDITNELTLMYGMPSHVFDLDKLAAQKLIIRESRPQEKVSTLDGQSNELRGGDIIIEDGAGRLIDLCGIMGGSIAEVDEHSKNILFIVPVYQPARIRKTSLYLQKRTLASQIYEKQPDTELCLAVLTQGIKLFSERAKARVSSSVFDYNPKGSKVQTVDLDVKWVNKLVGKEIPIENIKSILTNLGFDLKINNSIVSCTVPSWRKFDINIKQDLVEEIARVYGYSKLPAVMPCVNLSPEPKDVLLKTETDIKHFLSNRGFNEIFNNSLISEILINKAQLQRENHLKLTNALSKEFEYLRISLVPSLLQNIKNNQGKSDGPFLIYELANVYLPTKEKLPQESSRLVVASTADFRQTKGYLEALLRSLKLNKISFLPAKDIPEYYLPEHTAIVKAGNINLGYIGQIKPNILRDMGITTEPTIVELETTKIASSRTSHNVYAPISEFPELFEDMTIESKQNVGKIIDTIKSTSDLIKDVTYLNSYESKHTFKITFSSLKGNLSQKETANVKEKINQLFS